MFIAHLPAGYLLTRWFQRQVNTGRYLWLGLFGSIFPDLDLFYFYLIDDRQTLHHHYWTHLPLFWLSLWVISALVAGVLKNRSLAIAASIFFANVLLHCVLDTPFGGINWLYPFIDKDIFLLTIPNKYDFWVWNFVLHWTFLSEIAIITWASIVRWRARKDQ